MSPLALGCSGLSGTTDQAALTDGKLAQGVAVIAAAWSAGIAFYDFADVYGNGTAEMVWHAALAEVPGLRARAVVCTKAGVRRASADTIHQYDATDAHLCAALEGSLGRLGVDRVGLLLVHRPDPLTHPRETARALNAMLRDGRVGAVGVSNYTPGQVRALQAHLDAPLAAIQSAFSLWHLRPMDDGTLDLAQELGLLPMAYSPLARGLLTGRWSLPVEDPGQARLQAVRAELRRCAEVHDCSETQAALAWLLAHPAGVVAVVGTRQPEHVREVAAACRISLTRNDWYRLWVAARGAPLA